MFISSNRFHFNCVCKSWLLTISNPNFINHQFHHAIIASHDHSTHVNMIIHGKYFCVKEELEQRHHEIIIRRSWTPMTNICPHLRCILIGSEFIDGGSSANMDNGSLTGDGYRLMNPKSGIYSRKEMVVDKDASATKGVALVLILVSLNGFVHIQGRILDISL